jgi:hypothetical protein
VPIAARNKTKQKTHLTPVGIAIIKSHDVLIFFSCSAKQTKRKRTREEGKLGLLQVTLYCVEQQL